MTNIEKIFQPKYKFKFFYCFNKKSNRNSQSTDASDRSQYLSHPKRAL